MDPTGPLPPKDPALVWNSEKRIVRVTPLDAGLMRLDWSDGTQRVFDAWAWANIEPVEKLHDPAYYHQVAIVEDGKAIAWPDGQGFLAETLYENSPLVEDACVSA